MPEAFNKTRCKLILPHKGVTVSFYLLYEAFIS